jgi:hypothetical protein
MGRRGKEPILTQSKEYSQWWQQPVKFRLRLNLPFEKWPTNVGPCVPCDDSLLANGDESTRDRSRNNSDGSCRYRYRVQRTRILKGRPYRTAHRWRDTPCGAARPKHTMARPAIAEICITMSTYLTMVYLRICSLKSN